MASLALSSQYSKVENLRLTGEGMKTAILVLSLIFSSVAFASGGPNCKNNKNGSAHEKDKQKVARDTAAEVFKTYTSSKKSPNATI